MRSLDHLVLACADLTATRERLRALGFTVAPQGVHPFGTRNACFYLADGTMVEPLAVGDRAVVDAAASAGNSFVLGDRRFRAARGEEGFSAIVFSSTDADADHAAFSSRGLSGGSMVEFSRPSVDMEGKADTATFRLAFAGHAAARELSFFTCERRRAPAIDRSALESHGNGAVSILAVTASAADRRAFAAFLATIADSAVRDGDGSAEVPLANAALRVFDMRENGSGVRLDAIVFGVRELAATAALFSANGIDYEMQKTILRVPATAGQGADFVFEESS